MGNDNVELVLTRDQVRNVDRQAVDELGISSLVLMENAGRGCADVLCQIGVTGPVVICCGKGNNAGDGFVIARHLDLRGYRVKVLLWSDPEALGGDAATNYRVLSKTKVPVLVLGDDHRKLVDELIGADWIVDALLGTGAKGAPRSPLDHVIHHLNGFTARKLAVDVPSGLDCDSGAPAESTFRAHHTCTFVAQKPGFLQEHARPYLGQVHVLDIGIDAGLIAARL